MGDQGNLSRWTILVYSLLKTSVFQYVSRVLIELDIREGMLESLDIMIKSYIYSQIVDYSNAPFQCVRCCKYEHIAIDYTLSFGKPIGRKKKDIEAPTKELKGSMASDNNGYMASLKVVGVIGIVTSLDN